jgi:hypothetical protein
MYVYIYIYIYIYYITKSSVPYVRKTSNSVNNASPSLHSDHANLACIHAYIQFVSVSSAQEQNQHACIYIAYQACTQTAKVLYGIDMSLTAPHVIIDPWDVASFHWYMGNMQVKYVRHTLAEIIIPRKGKVRVLTCASVSIFTCVCTHKKCIHI